MRRLLMASLLLLPAASPSNPRPAADVSFQVLDEKDPQEISENTVIFIEGRQVAHFTLDKEHPAIIADITLPLAGQYDYALCGRITVAEPDGRQEEKVVDGGGTLKDVDGRLYRALAANDFSIFYLADAAKEQTELPKDVRHSNACSLPVS